MFWVIVDYWHGQEEWGIFDTRAEAIAEVERLESMRWDEVPNRAPCNVWRDCGRKWGIVGLDAGPSRVPETPILEITSAGPTWISA